MIFVINYYAISCELLIIIIIINNIIINKIIIIKVYKLCWFKFYIIDDVCLYSNQATLSGIHLTYLFFSTFSAVVSG